MKIRITTKFDCTTTGTTGHYRNNRMPYQDQAENTINDQDSWSKSRNQQRNYETLVQLLSLRTQLVTVGSTTVRDNFWEFEIESDRDDVFSDDFASLKLDCEGVPMIVDLNEHGDLNPVLTTQGSDPNIWFEKID